MNVSLALAVVLLAGKTFAAAITGSSAVYSDAAESFVHVFAVGFAAWALRLSYKPADGSHHYGHDKIAFISAGFEGAMISAAAVLILYQAGTQFVNGVEIKSLGLGMWITAVAAAVNLLLGMAILKVGRKSHSPLLLASGMHILTDVWTSVAVVVALILIHLTGWGWWDPLIAILAALNIMRVGINLFRESLRGLLDEADPAIEKEMRRLLESETFMRNLAYHNFRHRHSGRSHWIEFHLVFPDETSVENAHRQATEIEAAVANLISPDARVITHLEPRSSQRKIEEWEKP